MNIKPLSIEGIYEIELEPKVDSRGFFVRTYDEKIFKKAGIHRKWVQESHSLSKKKGTVRGFHFQHPPYVETKLVRVVRGKVLFIELDLRLGSKTFGKWIQIEVSSSKNNLLYLTKGIASCMCTLTDNCEVIYKMDEYFAPQAYDNIFWNDPELKIPWPIKSPSEISEKDLKAQGFKNFQKNYKGLKVK